MIGIEDRAHLFQPVHLKPIGFAIFLAEARATFGVGTEDRSYINTELWSSMIAVSQG